MKKNKSSVISVCAFAVIFGALLAAATFFDLEISRIVTRGALPEGSYYSADTFGAFFEVIGDSPVELMLIFAVDIIFVHAVRLQRGAKRVFVSAVSLAFSVTAGWAFCKISFDRICDHLLTVPDAVLDKGAYLQLVFVFCGALLAVTGIFAVNNFSDDSLRALLKFSLVVIIVAAVSTISVNLGIKEFFGRMRFRAMNVRPDDPVCGFAAFSRWYLPQGHKISDDILIKAFGTADANRSFPSGHTAAAGVSYALTAIPDALDIRRKRVRALFLLCPLAFTGAVAVSRMMVGAHFMSDVLMGGTLSFVLTAACRAAVFRKKHAAPGDQ